MMNAQNLMRYKHKQHEAAFLYDQELSNRQHSSKLLQRCFLPLQKPQNPKVLLQNAFYELCFLHDTCTKVAIIHTACATDRFLNHFQTNKEDVHSKFILL